ncbi:MAG TPA: nucleotide-binding protein [Candidatus Glassbacteria bacterium]|nr:nucleotide-binding protein [Candidatus Glassbacteria bacterium]
MKTKIDMFFDEIWGDEYKRMKNQIFRLPKGSHGFGDIGVYKDGIFWLKEKEFERLKEKEKSHDVSLTFVSESSVKDYLKKGAAYVKVADKPVKVGNKHVISNTEDCCLYVLTKDQEFLISEIYNYYIDKRKWPTARDILVKIGSINIKELFEDFPEDELLLYNQQTQTYRLTLFGILHAERDKSIRGTIDYIMSELRTDSRNSKDKSKILYDDICETGGPERFLAKEITESLLNKLGSGGSMTKQFYEVNIPNDEERTLLILNYHNPISLCHALFVKTKVFLPGVNVKAYNYPISETASRIGAQKMEKEAKDSKKVFIVHGHDEGSRESAARFVEKLGLSAIILHEQASKGKTIIEKFEDYADVGFAIVLLTPDDVGASSKDPEKLKPRARQNVIFELGYFIGKLGRGRVVALYKEGVEIPSDYKGVIFIPFDEHGSWKLKLTKELKTVWSDIDLNKAI